MSRTKNYIITALSSWLLYTYMQQSDPTTIYLVISVVAVSLMGALYELDKLSGEIVMKKRSFKRYKAWFLKRLDEKRNKGYDEKRLSQMALSIMTHQTKYAFNASQMKELLDLAKDDFVTNCIQCGKPVARKDVLVTVEGEMCEECLEVS